MMFIVAFFIQVMFVSVSLVSHEVKYRVDIV
jgi:hypothetical protein